MKSILLTIVLVVFLAACSSHATATSTPTVTATQTALAIPTQTEPLVATATAAPIATATEPAIVTPSAAPFATATATLVPPANSVEACVLPYRLTVRSGPGTTYNVAGVLKKSTCIYAIARNSSNTWFWEVSSSVNGWVSGAYLSPKGNMSTLPLIDEVTQTPGAIFVIPTATATLQPSPTLPPSPTVSATP